MYIGFIVGFLVTMIFHFFLVKKIKNRNTYLTRETIRLTREIIELQEYKLRYLKSQK